MVIESCNNIQDIGFANGANVLCSLTNWYFCLKRYTLPYVIL